MKRLILSSLALFALTECGLTDTSCRDSSYEDYYVEGDFLLDQGERIVFAPKCYYDPALSDLKCGLSALGVETLRTDYYSAPTMNCSAVGEGARFDYDSTDFSKLSVIMADGSTKPLLSYSYARRAYEGYYSYSNYGTDHFASFSRFHRADFQQVQAGLIESDSLGIVDFSVKDAKGNKIHMKYDLSYFISNMQSVLIMGGDSLRFIYGGNYEYLFDDGYLNEKCLHRSVAITGALHHDTNAVANTHIQECLNECSDCYGEFPVAKIEYIVHASLQVIPELVMECESVPEIDDFVQEKRTYNGMEDDNCKAFRVIPYVNQIYTPSSSGCKLGETDCPSGAFGERLLWGNLIYRSSQE